jgi:FAD dependent oxidoreductase TIGR03364
MSTSSYDLIVVGGGALGTFHAYHALNRGLKVALLERNQRPMSATVRNFGQVVPSGMDATWQQYGRKSLEIYKALQAEADFSIRANGSIYFASDDDELILIEELAQINKDNAYASELWTQAQCYARYPSLHPDYCKGALFFPEEVSVNPRLMIHRVLAMLQTHPNFSYFPNTLVRELDSAGNTCIASDLYGNRFKSEKVMVCCGSEFEWLYPNLFQASDIELVKLQMLRLKPQQTVRIPGNILTGLSIRRYESFEECPSYVAIHAKEDPDSFWRQWGVHILFKQEDDGSIILGDSHEYADVQQKDGIDFYLREEVTQYFIDEGAKIMNLEHWKVDDQWLGVYSQCKTQDIFQHTVDGKVHIVTGIGGKGMTGSPGFTHHHIEKVYGSV